MNLAPNATWVSIALNSRNRALAFYHMGHVKRIWYLSPMRAAKVQASLRSRAVSPEPLLLAHTSNESRGTFRQKARSLAPLNGWACAVKICHDGMLDDTNLLDAPHIYLEITTETLRIMMNANETGHEKMCLMSYASTQSDQFLCCSLFR